MLQKGIYAPTLNAVRRRAAELRSWLWNRPEKHIALVSHGAFLHYLTEDWATYDRARGMETTTTTIMILNWDWFIIIGTGYQNCEYRKFEFTEDSNEKEAHLFEVGSTRERQDRPPGLDAHVIHEMDEVESVQE